MLEAAIAHYHRLLDNDTARESWAQLNREMQARQLYFGQRPLCSVLRPRLISEPQYAQLQKGVGLIAEASRKITANALEDHPERAIIQETLLFNALEQQLLALHPGYPEPSAHSRMDTFLSLDGTLQFVEYNAESPAAIAYEDMLSEAFLQTSIMQAFRQHYRISSLPARQRMRQTLLESWEAAGSAGGAPRIAIVDWYDLPTAPEFVMFQEYFTAHGIPTVICSPNDLRFRDGQLFAQPREGAETLVTIVFKRVLTSELITHYGPALLEHPLVQAYAARSIAMVNSFRAKLLHKKSLFALLSDEQFHDRLSAEEIDAIGQHIPWTRVMRPGPTTYQGEAIDLLAFTQANRDRLLLKPNDDYGGNGITIGWESDETTWNAAMKAALDGSPFVVQERVKIAYEPYPSLIDGKVVIGERLVDSDPYLFGSEVDGCLCRLSTETLLNVTAGGGSTAPVFLISERE